MAGSKASDEDLKTAIAQARKKPLAFGLCLGKKPDATVLMTHKTKAASVLGQQARKAGETGKFTFGSMNVKSKSLLLTCEGDAPAGAAKKIKDFLKIKGFPMKVVLLDPAGGTLEADGEDEEDQEQDAGASAVQEEEEVQAATAPEEEEQQDGVSPQTDPLAPKWEDTAGKLQAAIEKASNGGTIPLDDARAKLQGLMDQAAGGAYDTALAGAKAVAAAIKAGTAAGAEVVKSNADQKRWDASAEKMDRLVTQTVAAGAGNIKKIQAVWNLAKTKAEAGDFKTGVKTFSLLTPLIQEARDAAAAIASQAAAADAGPAAAPEAAGDGVPEAAPAKPEEEGLMDTLSDAAAAVGSAVETVAGAVGDAVDAVGDAVSGAVEAAGEVVSDLAQAAADVVGLGGDDSGDGGVPVFITQPDATDAADLSGTVAEKIARAEARLTAVDGLITTYVGIIAGTAAPAAWGTERTRIAGVVATEKTAGATANEAKIDASLKELVTLETTIRGAIAKRTDWKAALELFEIRFDPLENHAQAAATPQIKPKIDDIKAKRDAAKADADALKFEDAIKAIRLLGVRCDAIRNLADAFAHYSAVLAQRTAVVTPLIGAAATGVSEIDTLSGQITTLFSGAQADAVAEKYADGVRKLDQIPPLIDRHRGLVSFEAGYRDYMNQAQGEITKIDAFPANVRATMTAAITGLKAEFEAAKVANTSNYSRSRIMMYKLFKRGEQMVLDLTASRTYLTKLTAFNTQLGTFEGHAGRAGIDDVILAMNNDRTSAAAEAVSGNFATAASLLDRSQPGWAAATTLAGECAAYIVKRDAVQVKITGLKSRPEVVAAGLGAAEDLMAAAAVEGVNKRYVTALATVTEAEARADAAQTAGNAQNALDALKDTTALDGLDADYEAAHKVFTDMRAHVATLDTGGTFSGLLTNADTEAQKARDAATGASPNAVAARGFLDGAIVIVEQTLPKVMASGAFATNLAAAKTMANTTLPNANDEDCIKAPIDEITALIVESETLAAGPGFDFAAAELKLVEAMATARKALADAALYPDIKRDKAAIVTLKGTITPAAVATLMVTSIARLDAILQGITDALAARDFPLAKTKAATGVAMTAAIGADVTSCTNYPVSKQAWIVARYPAATSTAAKPHVDRAKAIVTQSDASMLAGNYSGGYAGLAEGSWAMDAALVAQGDAATYKVSHDACKPKLDGLKALDCTEFAARIAEVQTAFDAAVAFATNLHFVVADRHMKEVDASITPELMVQARAAKGYADSKAAAQAARDAIDPAMADAVRPTIDRLTAKFTSAEGMAASDDFVNAKALMDEVKTAADAAKLAAENSAALTATMDAVSGLGPDDAPSAGDIKSVEDVIKALKARSNAAVASTELPQAEAKIATAKDAAKPASERTTALKEAAEAARTIEETLVQHNELLTSIQTARTRITTLESHAQAAYVATDVTAMKASLDAIGLLISGGEEFTKATSDLNVVMTRYAEVLEDAEGQAAFEALRGDPGLDAKLDALEQHDHSYAIRSNINVMRGKIALADTKAAEKDHTAAISELEAAIQLGHSAQVMADMRGNTAPTAADVKKIIDGPGGFAELDAMMAGLEPDAERAVMRAAFEARFGCTLENWQAGAAVADGTQQGPDIRRYYEIMSALPNSATLDNDSFRVFRNEEGSGGGSRYANTDKTVIMNERQPEMSADYLVGQENAVGTVDANCEPANEDPVTYFSWNTLHEVGHAVDDQHRFMPGKYDDAAYGGWQHHGRNTQEVAVAVAGEFDYDVAYTGQRLAKNANPAIPDAPNGVTPEDWESRRLEVEGWISRAIVGNKPWDAMSKATGLAIGGRVYHESYDDQWYSYLLAARSKGISGYQFRAPGEWFSELYAAYHSGKLKDTHPSAGWLSAL